MWGILGQWDILLLNLTTIGFTNFLQMSHLYDISIYKKEKIKDETSKRIRESNGGQWDILLLNLTSIGFMIFFQCLIFDLSFCTDADVVTIKGETSRQNS